MRVKKFLLFREKCVLQKQRKFHCPSQDFKIPRRRRQREHQNNNSARASRHHLTTTFLLSSLHHHQTSIVFPPAPSHFYCFHSSYCFPTRQAKQANLRPERSNSNNLSSSKTIGGVKTIEMWWWRENNRNVVAVVVVVEEEGKQ